MPGYGLPKNTKGLLPWSWADQQLKKSREYFITTVRPDGSPHAMIVWGLWIGNVFYFSTGRQSVKARNLAANPKCVVATGRADQAVIVEGKAELIQIPPEIKFFEAYEKKYKWDMSGMQQEPVFAVRPRVAFGLVEKTFAKSATRWIFKSR
jgi:pyridoxine/pyridoxamine 5'-phosphate oxidase